MPSQSIDLLNDTLFVASNNVTRVHGGAADGTDLFIASGYICPSAVTMHINGYKQVECIELETVSLRGTVKTWRIQVASFFDLEAEKDLFMAMRGHGYDLFDLERRQALLDVTRRMRNSETKKTHIPFKTTVQNSDTYEHLPFEAGGLHYAGDFSSCQVLAPGESVSRSNHGANASYFIMDEAGDIREFVSPEDRYFEASRMINWHATHNLMKMDPETGGLLLDRSDIGIHEPCVTYLFPQDCPVVLSDKAKAK